MSLHFELLIDVPQHLLYQTLITITKLKIHCQVSDGVISSSIEHQPLGLGCTKPMLQLHKSFVVPSQVVFECDITAWIGCGVAGNNILLISPAEMHTPCFPQLNLSLIHLILVYL